MKLIKGKRRNCGHNDITIVYFILKVLIIKSRQKAKNRKINHGGRVRTQKLHQLTVLNGRGYGG